MKVAVEWPTDRFEIELESLDIIIFRRLGDRTIPREQR